jgi:DNA-binding NarL/FixJ family response regulator
MSARRLSGSDSERADLVIADVRTPPMFTNEGLTAAIEARRAHPGLPVLVLSRYVEQLYARELLSSGRGRARLPAQGPGRPQGPGRRRPRIEAVRQVAAGGTVLDPKVVAAMVTRHRARSPVDALTPRERDVLALMAEGQANSGIAARLVITERAVGKHINNIFAKLGLPADTDGHRRVLAVLEYLRTPSSCRPSSSAGSRGRGRPARPRISAPAFPAARTPGTTRAAARIHRVHARLVGRRQT